MNDRDEHIPYLIVMARAYDRLYDDSALHVDLHGEGADLGHADVVGRHGVMTRLERGDPGF